MTEISDSRTGFTPNSPAVVIVGPSGSGRSSLGESLSLQLHTEFIESETAVEKLTGRKFSDLLLDDDYAMTQRVIDSASTSLLQGEQLSGGEIISLLPSSLRSKTVRDTLRSLSFQETTVVYLEVPLADLARRNGLNAPRSLAMGQPRSMFIQMVQEIKMNLEGIKYHTYENVGRAPDMVAAEIIDQNALK